VLEVVFTKKGKTWLLLAQILTFNASKCIQEKSTTLNGI
jgi:hypothetical protein